MITFGLGIVAGIIIVALIVLFFPHWFINFPW